ncbi:Peptidase A1 domain-containing protein [Aphelenchoides besseyi]|nr:Peptidase A1 domain-containing protein [Aphelenchoides besseyi]
MTLVTHYHFIVLTFTNVDATLQLPIRKKEVPIASLYHHNFSVQTSNSQSLSDYYGSFYVLELTLGTPVQTFHVALESSTSDLWVVDSECKEQQCKGYPESGYTKSQYDKTKSTTYKSDDRQFNITYQSGLSCTGQLAIDVIGLGGYSFDDQTFGAAMSIPAAFGYVSIDGYVGFGLKSQIDSNLVGPILNLAKQFDQPVFTIWLDRYSAQTNIDSGGLITFGSTDVKNCDSDITQAATSSSDSWTFELEKFGFGKYTYDSPASALLNIGMSFIGIPTNIFQTVMKTLNADYDDTYQMYTIDCGKSASSPKMLFTVNGNELFIEGNDYILDFGFDLGKCGVAVFDMSTTQISTDWDTLLSEMQCQYMKECVYD